MSRPLLNPTRQKALCTMIENGLSRSGAARRAGLDESTIRNWMQQGHADQEAGKSTIYSRLFTAVRMAEAVCEERMVQAWVAQTPTDWRAARDFLARRAPDDWAPIATTAISAPVTINAAILVGDPQVLSKAKELRDALASARRPDAIDAA